MNNTTNNIATQVLSFREEELVTVMVEEVLYFVGSDLARALGYKKPNNAINQHVRDEDKIRKRIKYKGQHRMVTLVNDLGSFDLIMNSKLDSALDYKKWLVRDVLPSIAKYGMYLTPEARELRESNPEQFENNYQEMATELENKERQFNTLKETSEQRRKEIQNLLDSMHKLQGELIEYKGRTMALEDDNLKKSCEIDELSKSVQKKSEELDSAMTVCEVATLPIHYAIGMSSLMDDMYVSEFSEMTRGKSLDIGRNTLYQIMREVGMLEKQGAYNVASDYGKKNGLVYDEELTIHREYVPFETYKKPKITQKGIALVMQEVAKRLNVQPENVFK